MHRHPGPLGSTCDVNAIDGGTLARTAMPPPGVNPGAHLSEAERELLLDITQMTLDIVGIVDPTPTADGANLAISLGRRDWFAAGLSAVSMIPYLGDAAKAGKIGKWAQTVDATVRLALRNAAFAAQVRPILRNLAALLEQIPTRLLPGAAEQAIQRMKSDLRLAIGRMPVPGMAAAIAAKRKFLFAFIDGIELAPPGINNGVLWSRIGEKGVVDGADLAARMAAREGKTTLEMSLKASGFEQVYKVASEQLKQALRMTDDEVWESVGRDAWKRASLRYTQTLRGRVTAYVRFSPARAGQSGINNVTGAYDPFKDPILFDELEAISEAMAANPHITSVRLTDIDDGGFKLLEREQLLRALRSTH